MVVVIATYNERDNIVSLIFAIRELRPGFRVLVVGDGSPDGTGRAVAGRGHLLSRPGKAGMTPRSSRDFGKCSAWERSRRCRGRESGKPPIAPGS